MGSTDHREAMQLIIAIVQDEDAAGATTGLNEAGFRVTRIKTTGGFLRKGNSTLLVVTPKSKVPRALLMLRENCELRTEFFVPSAPGEFSQPYPLEPIETEIGGATVFVLNVERFEQL